MMPHLDNWSMCSTSFDKLQQQLPGTAVEVLADKCLVSTGNQ